MIDNIEIQLETFLSDFDKKFVINEKPTKVQLPNRGTRHTLTWHESEVYPLLPEMVSLLRNARKALSELRELQLGNIKKAGQEILDELWEERVEKTNLNFHRQIEETFIEIIRLRVLDKLLQKISPQITENIELSGKIG